MAPKGRRALRSDTAPDEYLDEGSLVGPVARIKERWPEWRDSGVTGLTINSAQPETLELMADIADLRPND